MIDLYNKINLTLSPAERFTDLAKYLFFNCCLKVKNKKFYFTELEFYVTTSVHKDLFCHQSPAQKENGTLYCHGSGMDITCGNERKQEHGGVLIRGLKDSEGSFYDGPHISISRGILPIILGHEEYYSKSVHEKEMLENVHLEELSTPQKWQEMWQGPRHGLGKGKFDNEDESLRFRYAPYRYVIDVNKHSYKDKEKFKYVATLLGNLPDREKCKTMAERRLKSSYEKTAKEWRTLVNYYEKLMAD